MPSALTLWTTVRHLRPGQVAHRLRNFALRWEVPRNPAGRWRLRSRKACPPARNGPRVFDGKSFTFLNRSHRFAGADRWRPAAADRLWVYHLHYFRYLSGLPGTVAWQLVSDWLEANPFGEGPGWEPYPIALRLREWIEWLLGAEGLGTERESTAVASVAAQAEALAAQAEHHLDGNHLLEDAISLCWAGLSIDGPGADGWLRQGEALLAQCLGEQLLPDGGHDERSPMYQAILAEALLRLAEVAGSVATTGAHGVNRLADGAGRAMAQALRTLSHPDGDIALLNDAAFGIGPSWTDLAVRFPSLRREEPSGVFDLSASGYAGHRSDRGDYLVFDRGPIGPDHQPGHGHADTLSFELSVRGDRLVTDTGVFTYAPGTTRAADRGTAAHNTLSVDGREQADLWEAFRCGERPSVTRGGGRAIPGGVALSGEYEAAFGTFGLLRHARTLRYVAGERLEGTDEVTCDGVHEGVLRFHLAPGLAGRATGGGIEVREGGRAMAAFHGDSLAWRVERAPYHPEFGKEVERDCVVGRASFRDRLVVRWWLDLEACRG